MTKLYLGLYFGYVIGVAIESVGKVSPATKTDWTMVPIMFCFILIPTILGYFLAKEEHD